MEANKSMKRALAQAMFDFHRCPNTGKVIESGKDDNKALCGCGIAENGVVGLHYKPNLKSATVDDYMAQEEERRG
jgi:hypothetical protein